MGIRRHLGLWITGAICFSWVAVWNGYPLMTPDAGGYLSRALDLRPAFHQPIWYSIWILVTSLRQSLWMTVFLQSALLSACLVLLLDELYGNDSETIPFLLLASALSPLCWYASQIMADVFTPIFVVSLFLFLTAEKRSVQTISFLLLMTATAMHFSHWGMLVFIGVPFAMKSPRKLVLIAAACLIIFFASREINRKTTGSPALQKSAMAFLMGRLYETGILEEYLARHCAREHLEFCTIDAPRKGPINSFLWDRGSLHFKISDNVRGKEYRHILLGAAREFPISILEEAAIATFRQLSRFAVGDAAGRQGMESDLARQLETLEPSEARQFLESRQQQDDIGYSGWNVFYTLSLFLGILCLWIRRRTITQKEREWILFLACALVANAAICGAITGAFHRYEGRLIGLVTVTGIAVALTSLKRHSDRLFWRPRLWARRARLPDF